MSAYRKFSDVLQHQVDAPAPPKPGKAPKADPIEPPQARTLGGLGALGGVVGETENPPAPADTAPAFWGEAEEERAAIVEHDGSQAPIAVDAGWWRSEFAERAAHREYDGGHPRAEAELLAWSELQNRWNLAHGERVSRGLCAGCRRPIGTEAMIDLIDSNRAHDRAGHECLIRHGERWRAAATRALIAMGLRPPAGEDVP
jgi:hypothetical protein